MHQKSLLLPGFFLAFLQIAFSFSSEAATKNWTFVSNLSQCQASLGANTRAEWWNLFPPTFFDEGMKDTLIDANQFLDLVRQQMTRRGKIDLFFFSQGLLAYNQLNAFVSFSRGKDNSDKFTETLNAQKLLEAKLIVLIQRHAKEILASLTSPMDEVDDFEALLALYVHFDVYLPHFQKLSTGSDTGLLERIESKLVDYISERVRNLEKDIANLKNETFAVDSAGRFVSLHTTSKAMDVLMNRAASMYGIFQFATKSPRSIPGLLLEKMARIANQLLVYRPQAIAQARIAVSQGLDYRSFTFESATLSLGQTQPFPDLISAFQLLKSLEAANVFLEKHKNESI